MVNEYELLINAVTANRLKRLTSLPQNGTWSGLGAANSPDAVDAPLAERQHLRLSRGTCAKHGKPVFLPEKRGFFFKERDP